MSDTIKNLLKRKDSKAMEAIAKAISELDKPKTGEKGADGVGIKDLKINSLGQLIVTYSDDIQQNLGRIVGKDGKTPKPKEGKRGVGVFDAYIDNGNLILLLEDGKKINTGNVQGEKGESFEYELTEEDVERLSLSVESQINPIVQEYIKDNLNAKTLADTLGRYEGSFVSYDQISNVPNYNARFSNVENMIQQAVMRGGIRVMDESEAVFGTFHNITFGSGMTVSRGNDGLIITSEGGGGGAGTDDQTASEVSFAPSGSIAATDVQAALEELDTDVVLSAAQRHTHSNKAILDATTASFLVADETKLDYLTVTQAVDLDAIEARVNELDAAVVLVGTFDASGGSFPSATDAGQSYIVDVAGTIDSVEFNVGDRIVAIIDSPSTTTYASNWLKLDYTDRVSSVNGQTGVVVVTATDVGLGNVDNTSDVNKPVSTAQQTALDDKQNDLDGASLTSVTVAGTDKVLIQDTSDSDNLKTVTAQSIADLAAGGSGESVQKDISQSSHGFVVGDLVYHNGTSYTKSDASADATSEVNGMVTAVADTNNFTITTAGYVPGLSGLTAGDTYFLSETAGAITNTAPTTQGAVSKPVLHAISATEGWLNIMRGNVIGADATEFADDVFRVQDNADTTKELAFELSGVTTGTTRTLTVPNASGTIALTSDITATNHIKAISIPDPTDSEDVTLFRTASAITIRHMHAVLVGSATPSVTWTIRHNADRSATGAEVVTSGTTTTSTTTGSHVTSFNDATIPANSCLWLETTAQSGTVAEINVSLTYTED